MYSGSRRSDVLREVDFLRKMFAIEFPTRESPCPMVLFESTLAGWITKGYLAAKDQSDDPEYTVTAAGQGPITFMCQVSFEIMTL